MPSSGASAEEGLALEGLSRHWHRPPGRYPGLVLGFSRPSDRTFPGALTTLRTVLRRLPRGVFRAAVEGLGELRADRPLDGVPGRPGDRRPRRRSLVE